LISHAKSQQKAKNRKGKRGNRESGRLLDEDDEDGAGFEDVQMDTWMGSSAVKAPAIGPNEKRTSIAGDDVSSSEPYRVFSPKPSDLAELNAPWAWDEAETPEPSTPGWNPISGFSGAGEEAASISRPDLNPLILFSNSAQNETKADSRPPMSPSSKTEGEGILPSVTRDQVLTSCLSTSIGMGVIVVLIRQLASSGSISSLLGTDPNAIKQLLDLQPSNLTMDAAVALGSILLVTSTRLLLLRIWSDFSEASTRSNQQILGPLSWIDIALVALLTGTSEELLFRSALIPATFPDWRGAVLSGIIFGILHNSGGRNFSFALWASGVGIFYGGLFVTTHDVWVPVVVHSSSNLLSAVIFKQAMIKSETSSQ
jgi:membrane protease YdiL (CAAX protease family)